MRAQLAGESRGFGGTLAVTVTVCPPTGARVAMPQAMFRAPMMVICTGAAVCVAGDDRWHAHRLGYTVRTLTRACMAAVGKPVKHGINARAALEVKRLPAHADEPVATTARRPSFPDPTNFAKFFTRLIGTCPGTFRHIHQDQ